MITLLLGNWALDDSFFRNHLLKRLSKAHGDHSLGMESLVLPHQSLMSLRQLMERHLAMEMVYSVVAVVVRVH